MNKKVYNKVLSGKSDNNISFRDFEKLISDLGFSFQSQEGSHKTYSLKYINARITILPDGNKAHGYQIRIIRNIIKKHNL